MDVNTRCFICGDGADYTIRISTEFGFQMAIPICEFHNFPETLKVLVNMTRITGSPKLLESTFGGKVMGGPYYQSLMGQIESGHNVEVFRIVRLKNLGFLESLIKWLFGGKK